jgi:hypothetical protein
MGENALVSRFCTTNEVSTATGRAADSVDTWCWTSELLLHLETKITAKITTANTTERVTVTAIAAGPNSEAEDEGSIVSEDTSGIHDAGAGPARVNPLGHVKQDVTAGSMHVLQLLSQILPAEVTEAVETRTEFRPSATTGNSVDSFGT